MSVRECSTHVPIIAIIITTRPNFIIARLFIYNKIFRKKCLNVGLLSLSLSLSLFLSLFLLASLSVRYKFDCPFIASIEAGSIQSVKRENGEEEGHTQIHTHTYTRVVQFKNVIYILFNNNIII